jgi:hypothetical protein
MNNLNFRRIYYHVRHRYLTMNNVVIAVAFFIGISWAWGSIGMMQRNYALQKEVDTKARNLKLAELETQNLKYEQRYYASSEYQELEVRKRLGLANPGEHVLILPPNTQQAKDADVVVADAPVRIVEATSDFQQWMNFLFGGNRKNLQ